MILIEQIRWAVHSDLRRIVQIDRCGYRQPWDREKFVCMMSQRPVICVVCCDAGSNPIGYCLYRLAQHQIHIKRLAVDPAFRRIGVASAMVQRLIEKLSNQRRTELVAEVAGYQVAGQCCLASCGFVGAMADDDAVRFVYEI